MFKWNKMGKIFDPRDYPEVTWMHEYAQAPATLIFDNYVRVYFSCRPERDKQGQFVSYSGYVDLDRKDLTKVLNISQKPILELGKKGTFDEFGTYPISVIRNQDQVWAYYAGWTRGSSVPFCTALGWAKSIDGGATFQKLGSGPVLSYSPDEPFILSGPKIRKFENRYYLFYIAGKAWTLINGRPEISHRIRLATSRDGTTWEKHAKDLIVERWDENESQASPDVIYANGKYHMFFCGWVPASFRNTRSRQIGYASSVNLVDWERDDAKAGITISTAEDAFDNEMVAYPHVFELDGETYMLYLGNEVGRYGFGLAKLEGEL